MITAYYKSTLCAFVYTNGKRHLSPVAAFAACLTREHAPYRIGRDSRSAQQGQREVLRNKISAIKLRFDEGSSRETTMGAENLAAEKGGASADTDHLGQADHKSGGRVSHHVRDARRGRARSHFRTVKKPPTTATAIKP